jgi:hypothetical protein
MKSFKLTTSKVTGNYIEIDVGKKNKDKYLSTQYISYVLKDNDEKIDYNDFMTYEDVKYFKSK